MAHRNDAPESRAAGEAIERVMREERDAAAALAQARRDADAIVEAARDEGRAIVNRAAERIARWQAAHALAVDGRAEALRAQADRSSSRRGAAPGAVIDAAVARVVERLTGPDADDDGGGAR